MTLALSAWSYVHTSIVDEDVHSTKQFQSLLSSRAADFSITEIQWKNPVANRHAAKMSGMNIIRNCPHSGVEEMEGKADFAFQL